MKLREKSYDSLIGRPTLILVAATLPYGYFISFCGDPPESAPGLYSRYLYFTLPHEI